MSRSRHRLTPELQGAICRFILSGAYPHAAAEAAGLPREVFERWLRLARARRPKRKYRLFHEAVMQAQAQVRVAAESRALLKDPLAWLKCGPGKEMPDSPGWSNPARAQGKGEESAVNLLLHRQTQVLVSALLRVLQPFPDARTAVAEALANLDGTPTSPDPGERGV